MHRLSVILLGLLIAASVTNADPAPVRRYHSSNVPSAGHQTLNIKELWRAGGLDEEILFGVIVDAATDDAGNVYILDTQLCQVMVFSPEGRHLRTLSREGEGPGEIQQPTDLVMLPDQTIGIVMGFPGKIVKLNSDDTPAGTLYPVGDPSTGGFGVLQDAEFASDKLVACGNVLTFGDGSGAGTNTGFLTVDDLDCKNPQRFLETTTPLQIAARKYVEADEYSVDGRWGISSQGRIYAAANRDEYEISVFDLTGKQIGLIERDYEPRKRTQAEKDLVGSDMHVVINGEEIQFDRFVEDHDPCITRMVVRDDDSIWVLPPQGVHDQDEGILETWDVFDPNGKFTKQVAIPIADDIRSAVSMFLGQDRLLIINGSQLANEAAADDTEENDEDIVPIEVICYQIQRMN